jgi:glycosyltransferase involved in cell wall biosynthesis
VSRAKQWAAGVVYRVLYTAVSFVAGAIALVLSAFIKSRRRELVWTPEPLINTKYWSNAMRKAGWASTTLMTHHYSAFQRADFDRYIPDLVPRPLRRWSDAIAPYAGFLYIVRNASVVHIPFTGGPLGRTRFWRLEAQLLRRCGIKIVITPYGGDYYRYSRVVDPVVRNALLISYPAAGRAEPSIAARVNYWCREADVVIVGNHVDGIPRWDIPAGSFLCIDTEQWAAKRVHSDADGRSAPVRVMHAPNHRGIKGTEFLLAAVEELRAEGLDIDLELVEGRTNDEVRRLMGEVDVFADQFILSGYGLAAIEGMASGLPVMCNLEDDYVMRLYRLYSFVGECPVVSASPELIADRLRTLITRPDLRRELGEAGRRYVERFHSEEAAQYLFGSIYRKLLDGEDVDLINLFHPLKSAYMTEGPLPRSAGPRPARPAG